MVPFSLGGMRGDTPISQSVRRAVDRLLDATDRMLFAAREVEQARAALDRVAARVELRVMYDDGANGEGGGDEDKD
jgi:hypothetical protein